MDRTLSTIRSIRLLSPKQSGSPAVSKVELVERFPIVGVGASAEGLAAFEAFFLRMPAVTERKWVEDFLQKVFDEICNLRGIVPICLKCKQIRNDKGFWSQVEIMSGIIPEPSSITASTRIVRRNFTLIMIWNPKEQVTRHNRTRLHHLQGTKHEHK